MKDKSDDSISRIAAGTVAMVFTILVVVDVFAGHIGLIFMEGAVAVFAWMYTLKKSFRESVHAYLGLNKP